MCGGVTETRACTCRSRSPPAPPLRVTGAMGDFNGVATAFVDHYYNTFDTNRAGLASLYTDQSMLSFEGQQFQVGRGGRSGQGAAAGRRPASRGLQRGAAQPLLSARGCTFGVWRAVQQSRPPRVGPWG